jgi:hypothetical protein
VADRFLTNLVEAFLRSRWPPYKSPINPSLSPSRLKMSDYNSIFYLVVSDTIHHARCLTGWQDFKDHLRTVVPNQPGWCDVYSSTGAEKQGWAKFRSEQGADCAYSKLLRDSLYMYYISAAKRPSPESFSGSPTMTVHLFQDGVLIRCNCSSRSRDCSVGSPLRPSRDFTSPARSSAITGIRQDHRPTMTNSPLNPWSFNQPTTQPQAPNPPLRSQWPNQPSTATINIYAKVIGQPQHPMYVANSFGLRVNVQRGAILAEPRTIFIKNLSYRCSQDELNVLLKDNVGHFGLATLLKDFRGAYNGAATAEFLSSRDAQRAISVLEGFTHMGRTLHARLAKEETHIGQTGPLVVASPIYENV